MKIILIMCILSLVFLGGCQKPYSSMNEELFKNYENSNTAVDPKSLGDKNSTEDPNAQVNSSTTVAQPVNPQPVTLVNVAF